MHKNYSRTINNPLECNLGKNSRKKDIRKWASIWPQSQMIYWQSILTQPMLISPESQNSQQDLQQSLFSNMGILKFKLKQKNKFKQLDNSVKQLRTPQNF